MRTRPWFHFGLTLAVLAALVALVALVAGTQPARVQAQAPKTLKIQASWPAALTIYDNFTMWAKRVEQLTGGQLKIETLPAGAIVPAFEVLDATHKKVIDGAHTWAAYWTGKHKAAVLFTGGPGGTFGMDYIDYLGWMYEGGGLDLYQEFYREVLKLNVVPIPILPSGPQAFGWFKRPIKNLADFKGMKCRQTGMAAEVYTEMGMRIVNMPGGEIIPAAERGVIDCAEWIGGVEDLRLGFHNVWKYHYTPGMHENVTVGELLINGDVWQGLPPVTQEIIKAAAMETFIRWWARWQKQNADALAELQDKHKVQISRTPDDILIEFLRAWDRIAKREGEKNPFFKKVHDSQRQYASKVVPAKRFMFPPYEFAANYYWPPKK
ncbi:MAG: TRAP transporter substrate-binding protein [Candidatus Rokubacteria bacterium]|nr:TRAP transporter substrate-binding protein [Candidatus Rokubacteria bacterium]